MSTIEHLRELIKSTDATIIQSLALRHHLCKKIARLKLEQGIPMIDLNQEKKNFDFYELFSKECELDPHFVAKLFRFIIINSRTLQLDLERF